MKTKTLLLSVISMLVTTFLSCEKDVATTLDNDPNSILVCGTKDPIKDLKWLSDEMKLWSTDLEKAKIANGVILFEYKGSKIIEVQGSLYSSTNLHQYNCDGTKLDFTNPDNFRDYRANRKKIKIIYGTEIW
jgi:hypothetical protein